MEEKQRGRAKTLVSQVSWELIWLVKAISVRKWWCQTSVVSGIREGVTWNKAEDVVSVLKLGSGSRRVYTT